MLFKSLIIVGLMISGQSFAANNIFSTAKSSLEANIIELSDGAVLRAGAHQFASLWTRDFCFASRGLRAIGRQDVIADHLSKLLDHLRPEDGLVPRVLDSKASWRRVARYSFIPFRPFSPAVKGKLKAEFKGEHGTVAIDSNALVLITAFEYMTYSGDQAWFDEHRLQLKKVLDYYRPFFSAGIVTQDKYADWQDSVKRTGATFFTNFLVWKALEAYSADPYFKIPAAVVLGFREKLESQFYDTKSGLYKSLDHGEWVSLEGILYALEDDKFLTQDAKIKLYEALKRHPLWAVIPGRATFPSYPRNQISLTTKVVGLRRYHDGLVWPWLTAFAAKIAHKMGDESSSRRIRQVILSWAKRDGEINEVMDPKKKMRPVRRMFYTSEAPFSWGAGFTLDMLNQIEAE